MEMQSLIDGEAGHLWLERRRYAGAIVREKPLMEGLRSAKDNENHTVVENYVMWQAGFSCILRVRRYSS